MARAWALLFLLTAQPSFAQFLSDEFEGNLLPTPAPAGQWDMRWYAGLPGQTSANFSIDTQAAAARRGGFGLRIFDAHVGSGAGTSGFMTKGYDASGSAVTPPPRYARFWLRPTALGGAGISAFFDLASAQAVGSTVLEVRVNTAGPTLDFGCIDRTQTYTQFGATPLKAGWQLIEVGVENMDSAAGRCVAAVDGTITGQAFVDLTGYPFTHVTVGQHYADLAATSTLDLDGLQLDVEPPAAALALDAGAWSLGSCEPLWVGLIQSIDGGLARSPLESVVALSADSGGISFWTDPTCTAPLATHTVAPTQSTGVVYLRVAVAGSAVVTGLSADLLAATIVRWVDGGTDAGVDAGALDGGWGSDAGVTLLSPTYRVGCECGGMGPALGLLAMALKSRWRRRANGGLEPRRVKGSHKNLR